MPVAVPRDEQEGEWDMLMLCVELGAEGLGILCDPCSVPTSHTLVLLDYFGKSDPK